MAAQRLVARLVLALALVLTYSSGFAHAASGPCERVQLALAPGITPEIVTRDWGSGETHAEPHAVLELRGCGGGLVDRLELEAPLATLDPKPLRGAPNPTWLVSADLTAPAGSTSGPLTLPVEVVGHRLRIAEATTPAGEHTPIRLALTGKAAWKRVSFRGIDDLLAVRSEAVDGGFVTVYRRYHPGRHGWETHSRQQDGLWESDGPFPPTRSFP